MIIRQRPHGGPAREPFTEWLLGVVMVGAQARGPSVLISLALGREVVLEQPRVSLGRFAQAIDSGKKPKLQVKKKKLLATNAGWRRSRREPDWARERGGARRQRQSPDQSGGEGLGPHRGYWGDDDDEEEEDEEFG